MRKIEFKGKNILVFIPNGRGIYGSNIATHLENQGARVKVFDERPSQTIYSKIFIRLFKILTKRYFLSYLRTVIIQNKSIDFDYILVIRAEPFTPQAVELLKSTYKNARLILYLWDSVKNTNTTKLFPYFDRILSFDREDSSNYELIHRPLFFIDLYRQISPDQKQEYDILFIGKVHSDRYSFLRKVVIWGNKSNLKFFLYLYFPSRFLYIVKKITDLSFFRSRIKEFNFKMLDAARVAELTGKCKSAIDIQHPKQDGLTMRSIEVLGAKRKLITTNTSVRNYDFYNENNVLIVDRKNPQIDKRFLERPYQPLPADLYFKYSLQGWIDDVFN